LTAPSATHCLNEFSSVSGRPEFSERVPRPKIVFRLRASWRQRPLDEGRKVHAGWPAANGGRARFAQPVAIVSGMPPQSLYRCRGTADSQLGKGPDGGVGSGNRPEVNQVASGADTCHAHLQTAKAPAA